MIVQSGEMCVTDRQTDMGIIEGSMKKLTYKSGLEIRAFPKEMEPGERTG